MNAREQLAIFLAVLVAIVWAVVGLASIKTKEFTALTIITPVMLLVVGYAVGVKPSDVVKRSSPESSGEDKK